MESVTDMAATDNIKAGMRASEDGLCTCPPPPPAPTHPLLSGPLAVLLSRPVMFVASAPLPLERLNWLEPEAVLLRNQCHKKAK